MQQKGTFCKILPEKSKKSVLVLPTFAPMTETSTEDIALDWVSYIYYPVQFKKEELRALIDIVSEVDAITPTYAVKLGLKVRRTHVQA